MGTPADRLRDAVARIDELTRGRPTTGLSHDDADGDVGTIASDHAIGFDPIPVLRAFAEHGARTVVICQVAGILHGSAELTGDLDLLWSGQPDDAQPIARAFASLGARLTSEDGS